MSDCFFFFFPCSQNLDRRLKKSIVRKPNQNFWQNRHIFVKKKCFVSFILISIYYQSCLSVCLSVCQSVCLSVFMSVCLSVNMTICVSVCLSNCLFVYMSVYLSIFLSIKLSACLSVNLFFSVRTFFFALECLAKLNLSGNQVFTFLEPCPELRGLETSFETYTWWKCCA